MNIKRSLIFTGITVILVSFCFNQTTNSEEESIIKLIQDSYINAAYNNIDIQMLKKGFHESFIWQGMHHERLFKWSLKQWIIMLNRQKLLGPEWNNRTKAKIRIVGIEGNAAVAKVDIFNNQIHDSTDFLSVYKFQDGWKIINKISHTNQIPPEVEYKRRLEWEKSITDKLQPPEKVLDAIGVKLGMTIGEIGAGFGRYTVHLARKVGDKGKVLANNIDKNAITFLRDRCRRENISNVETLLGKEDDPNFPDRSLDMAFMVWVFHGLEKPGPLFKNLISDLKPGAFLVIIDAVDSEIDLEREVAGMKKDPKRPTIKERVEKTAEEAGFKIVRIETFLPKDYIFILQAKTEN